MFNQNRIQDFIPKEKTHYLEMAKQGGIYTELLTEIRDACELLKKMYWESVKATKEANKMYLKYQPQSVKENPEEWCRHTPKFAYDILCREVGGPDELILECIDCGILLKDDTFGYVFKDNQEVTRC